MFDMMFSRDPFAHLYNDFEDFGPWTNWGYNRTPPRQQRRSAGVRPSADPDEIIRRNYRRRQPTWATPFWEIPCQYDEEMPGDNPVEEDYHARAPRKGGKCRRHKARVIPRDNEVNSEENTTSSGGEIRQDAVQQQAQGNSSEKEKVCEEKERQSEETRPAMKASPADTNEMEEEQLSEDKLEECETINENSTGEKIHETGEKVETEQGKEKMNEEEPSEDENQENKMENQEEKIEEKLKLIDEQLKKAKELAPKEVLMSPRTEKQKLYLTEMLLRCILELDSIETRGNENVKQRRREVVREIQSYLDIVENDQETDVALES